MHCELKYFIMRFNYNNCYEIIRTITINPWQPDYKVEQRSKLHFSKRKKNILFILEGFK